MVAKAFAKTLVGQVIAQEFEVLRPLGHGGMGVVVEAKQLSLDRLVALKVLLPSLEIPQAAERFVQEGRAMARIAHENVVTVHAAGVDGELAYIAMEKLHGRSLTALVREGPVPLDEAIRLIGEIASGVGAAHAAGIVHRDLKPANIFLHQTGSVERVKVLDFGIAKVLGEDAGPTTRTGHFLGTFAYMAPERVEGSDVTPKAGDVYSLGVLMYEMLAGKRPFAGEPARLLFDIVRGTPEPLTQVQPRIPESVATVVHQAMHRDTAQRFESMETLRTAVEALRTQVRRPTVTPLLMNVPVVSSQVGLSSTSPSAQELIPDTTPVMAPSGHRRAPKETGSLRRTVLIGLLIGLTGVWVAQTLIRMREAPQVIVVPPVASRVVPDASTPVVAAVEPARPGIEPASDERLPIRRNPDEASRSYNQGKQALLQGDLSRAKTALIRCLRHSPNNADCHRILGVLYAQLSNTQLSIRHYRRYVQLRPKAADAERVRTMIRQAEGESRP